jgi:predicted RNA-binding Zn-ribbon protein involved in translation (DUF1610 family)
VIISSRTPEGEPNRCAVCGAQVRIEPSMPARDAPCPNCGSLLWFTHSPRRRIVQRSRRFAGKLAKVVGLFVMLVLLVLAFRRFTSWSPSLMEVLIIVGLAVLLFGKRLPEAGRWLGKWMVDLREWLTPPL